MQYTVRGIPTALDAALRERARTSGKSLNEATLDALAEGTGLTGAPRKREISATSPGPGKRTKPSKRRSPRRAGWMRTSGIEDRSRHQSIRRLVQRRC